MDQYYLTPERLEELKSELNQLKTAKRAEVAERLKRAKEMGDLSENSEYFEAREEQSHVEARIFELEEMIKNASVIAKPMGQNKTVQIGSTIEVSREGVKQKFTIVGSNEAKPEAGLISNESPLGKEFLGKEVGAVVKVKTPKGEVSYKILSVE
jgi:transcription elongation factor GreA